MALAVAHTEQYSPTPARPPAQPQVREDRRLHRRVPVHARVRGLTRSGVEFEAVSLDICAGGMRIGLGKPLPVGEPVVLYIDSVGRVEGVILRPMELGYAVRFTASVRKQDRIADQLTWLHNRTRLGLPDDRVAERRAGGGQVVATYGRGGTIACAVLDVSVTGLGLRTNGPRPLLGDAVTINGRTGRCVRYFEGGFAVDFGPSPVA